MDPEEALWAEMQSHHGLTTVRTALSLDVSRHEIAQLVKRGRLWRPAYGILAATGAPKTREQALVLGVLIASNRSGGAEVTAAVSRPTAGFLWGLMVRDEPTIYVTSTRKISPRKGYRFHLTSRLPNRDIVELHGVKVTDPIRTFLDLCHSNPHAATYLYKRGLRLGLFTPEGVMERIEEESRQGREGLRLARGIVARTDPTATDAKSGGEDRYFNLLVSFGYPPPQRNIKVRGALGVLWEIDLYYAQVRKGFDYSPYDTHMNPTAHTQDGRKDLDLRARGDRAHDDS